MRLSTLIRVPLSTVGVAALLDRLDPLAWTAAALSVLLAIGLVALVAVAVLGTGARGRNARRIVGMLARCHDRPHRPDTRGRASRRRAA
jgi:hypothetical protein